MPIEEYTLKREMVCEQYGKAFLLPRGSKCHYFEHNDCYLFEAQNGYVPYFDRATVEKFPQFFSPVKRASNARARREASDAPSASV